MMAWGVQLEGVTATWSKHANAVLDQVSCEFIIPHHGNKLPLMGPSGQGKSTLLYLLAALKWPTAGKITWRFPDGKQWCWGAEGHQDSATLRRDYFGFSFQNNTLSPYMTVMENIAYPLALQGESWSRALSHAETTLNDVLLPIEKADEKARLTLLTGFPDQLSGGQRQRVALAQAMIHNPYVLFADEPTGQLDLPTRKQVMAVLKRWVAEGERCLIWVTHHHLDDLDLMALDQLMFVEQKTCVMKSRSDLKKWLQTA